MQAPDRQSITTNVLVLCSHYVSVIALYFKARTRRGQKGQIVRKLGARTCIIRSSLGVLYKRNRVHNRPDHSSTCDVVFNPTYTSTCDVVPSPSSHTSVVASQNAPPAVNDTVSHARPQRFCRPPERLRDYVCY